MPKETFYNLPEKKRKLIEKAAVSEFALYGYDKASITRIVDKCRIAKGSFYQYFDDKKDLYVYLLNRIGEEKIKALAPVIQKQDQYEFFAFIRALFSEGLKFAVSNPDFELMGGWMLKNKNHPIYIELMEKSAGNAEDMYVDFLKSAIARGEIRDDIDLGFIGHVMSSLSVSVMEYHFLTKKKDQKLKFDEEIMDTVDLFLDFLKRGIGK